jgi:hypothetical protein
MEEGGVAGVQELQEFRSCRRGNSEFRIQESEFRSQES